MPLDKEHLNNQVTILLFLILSVQSNEYKLMNYFQNLLFRLE